MKKFIVGLFSVVVLLLLLAGAGEVGTRWMISKQLKQDFAASSSTAARGGEEPSISFGSYPVLLGALQKNIHHVELDTPSTLRVRTGDDPSVEGTPAAHIIIDDLDVSNPDRPIAGRLQLDTEVPDEYILAQAQLAMKENQPAQDQNPTDLESLATMLLSRFVQITDVTSDAAEGTLDVEFTGGAAGLSVQPHVVNGQVEFEAAGANLFGIDMPTEVTDALSQGLKNSATGITGNLEVEDFEVVDNGLNVVLSGTNVDMKELGN